MGRHKKEILTDEQMEELVISKYLTHSPMTCEEAAFALWLADGKKTKRPMTRMGLLKIEQRALKKVREGLKHYGIKSFDDVFDVNRSHRIAKQNKFEAPDEE